MKCSPSLLLTAAVFLCVATAGSHSTTPPGSSPGGFRAQQTLNGLMDYYWDHDPVAKNISFFFACGQIGGQGSPKDWSKCSCYTPDKCLNCYRWWDAIAIESLATYGIYTNSSNHTDIPVSVFDHSPYNGDWDGQSATFVDDFAWYGIAYLRVYEWLNVRGVKLDLSISGDPSNWQHDITCRGQRSHSKHCKSCHAKIVL